MDERPAAAPEGWSVRHKPAVIAAVATPLLLALLLVVAGWFYDRDLRPATRAPTTPFPAPGLETAIHDGARDPHRPPVVVEPDMQVRAAKRAVLAEGIAGWDRRP